MATQTYPTTADVDEALNGAGSPTINPVLTITSQYGAFPADTENYINCVYSLTGVPGQPDVYTTGRVRGRGNNTWGLPKKPLRVKLDDSHPLLGMPTSKDWALLANYNDRANVSNMLAFTLGQMATGLDWTTKSGYVDVHFNGDYLGQYQLIEQVEFGPNRINHTKATGTTGLPLTGAYSLELNGVGADPGKAYITTGQGVGVLMDDPSGSTAEHVAYMTDWLTDFEAVLYGSGFADPTTGFRAWIDTDAWIDWYLIEELAGNSEGAYASSCKCVKTRDTAETPGRLVMGPLWDFDRSFGVTDSLDPTTGSILTHTPHGAKWHARAFEDPTFVAEAGVRWAALKAAITAAGGINKIIERIVARVAPSQGRDAHRWDRDYSYADLMATTKAYAAQRVAFLDAAYPAG